MRKANKILILLAILTASALIHAATLSGVTLPDTASVKGRTLILNGMGLRTKFIVRIYVAGLYLESKSSDPNAIIESDELKRIVLQFVHAVSRAQVADSFNEAFNNNVPDAAPTMKAEIARLLGAVDSVKAGDQMVLTYLPGTGTTLALNGKNKLTIATPAFRSALFAIWLGPRPPNPELKRGLLGK